MSKRLLIIGAGGAGREVADFVRDMSEVRAGGWAVAGFLDQNNDEVSRNLPFPVLGDSRTWKISEGEIFVCAIGNPEARERTTADLESRGAEFVNVIHPTSRVSQTAIVGKGVVIYPGGIVSTDTRLGNHVMINMNSVIGHDAEVGDYSVLSSFCDVTGNVTLGKRVFLGSHASLAPGVRVGDDAMVGMGSVVVNNIRQGKRVFGNPARGAQF